MLLQNGSTHVDKTHVHSHIIFNSTSLNYDRKFRNFWNSSFAIRRISDQLCIQHGLSIIEKPQPSRGHYGTWLGDEKPQTQRDKLRGLIDEILEKRPADFDAFVADLRDAGCEVKRGKYLSIRPPDGKQFLRCKSFGDDYTEEAIRERISGKRIVKRKPSPAAPQKVNMLIDIQAKLKQGYGAGFERFAKVQNLKEMAKTLTFLQENGLTDYEELDKQATQAAANFSRISDEIKAKEHRMMDINELQKHISTYIRTRDVYADYRKAGYSKKFLAAHESDIILHQAAKKYFDTLGLKKLPSIKTLKQEYAVLQSEKNKLYQSYKDEKERMHQLVNARHNVDRILNVPQDKTKRKDIGHDR